MPETVEALRKLGMVESRSVDSNLGSVLGVCSITPSTETAHTKTICGLRGRNPGATIL